MNISLGDHVIFKREVINKQFLVEFGTSGAFLSYKVVGIEDNEVTLQPDFGYPFNVPINDVEHRPKDFDPDKMVAELADRIDAFEHCTSLTDIKPT